MSDDRTGSSTATRVPEVTAEVRDDGSGEVTIDGVVERVTTGSLQEAGAAVTARIAELAGTFGQPIPVQVRDPDGLWSLLIHEDGLVDEAPPSGEIPVVSGEVPVAVDEAAPASGEVPAVEEPQVEPADDEEEPAPASAAPTPSRQELPTLDDLLAARHPFGAGGPAEHGWQVGIRRATFGLVKLPPGQAERRHRIEAAAVRRTLDGPRTVVVVNPKGGAHKTTATMLLASTFGLQRGGYTLAWDNNETRGTLGWRSTHGDHTRTAVDLLRALPDLQRRGQVRIGDLDGYVRTQPSEQFDVLASDEDSASAASVDAAAFASLHDVLAQFYRIIVVDTGNNMRASNWQAAVDAADQIVVVTTVREDTAQSAAWALDALRATGHEDAVRRAVTVLSAPGKKVDQDLRKRLGSHFGALTRAVLDVPYDRSLVAGGPIDYDALSGGTRDAWLHVTAVVAEGL
jgi:MinD-like ATPase involved in chromosome partitioning or flagellar assembly